MKWNKVDRIGIKVLEWLSFSILAIIVVFVFIIAVQILIVYM